jgi:hypothetical protein
MSMIPLEEAAAAKRAALASDWLTAAEVSRSIGSTEDLADKMRRDGKLLAVYLDTSAPGFRFPNWQFRDNGQPVRELPHILTVLREQGPFLDESLRTTGWGELEWFISPHVLLDGATPAEILVTAPNRVLAAAELEFGEST